VWLRLLFVRGDEAEADGATTETQRKVLADERGTGLAVTVAVDEV
jgi:hypothetical protein